MQTNNEKDVLVEAACDDKYWVSFLTDDAMAWAALYVDEDNSVIENDKLLCSKEQLEYFSFLMFDAELTVDGTEEFAVNRI